MLSCLDKLEMYLPIFLIMLLSEAIDNLMCSFVMRIKIII